MVGKLNDEQLNRVGNLIDLYEDKYKHLLSQHEDMEHIGMVGTKLYRKSEQVLVDTFKTLIQLKKVFQSGFLDVAGINSSTLYYILKGE